MTNEQIDREFHALTATMRPTQRDQDQAREIERLTAIIEDQQADIDQLRNALQELEQEADHRPRKAKRK